ncbi:MAG: excinuclease ABC subunit A, partial [Bacteroidales bacterium]|nr:excinuclease ABC subunit A [Bacteroidales bacterium]
MTLVDNGVIKIRGARVNNLKNIDLDIPRGRFTVVTGLSGSGKSSLVFDTLFAEGQRRFAESLSSYARQFLGRMSKPDVDSIEGIPPAVAIEQKVNVRNPRSTIATSTELYDFIRIIFARIGRTYSPISGVEVCRHTIGDVMEYIDVSSEKAAAIYILADLNWSARDDKVELMLSLKEEGYSRFYADKPTSIEDVMKMAETENYPEELYLLVDRLKISGEALSEIEREDLNTRLFSSVQTAFDRGNGTMYVLKLTDGVPTGAKPKKFVNRLEADGMVFAEPDEYMFSFNSPLGACPVCGGLGKIIGISEELVVPDPTKSIYDGAIACWRGEKMGWFKDHLIQVAERYG